MFNTIQSQANVFFLYAGKHWNFKMVIVAIVVAIVVAVLLSIAGYCFLAKTTKKTSDNAPAFYGKDFSE